MTWAKAQTCSSASGRPDRNAKQVLVHLASYADAAGEAWVLVSILALEMDVDERTVQRGKRALIRAGLLIETGQTRVHRGRVVPIYRLPLETGHASTLRRLNAEREAALSRGDATVTPNEGAGRHPCHPTLDAPVTPLGDTRVTQIGNRITQDKPLSAGGRARDADGVAGPGWTEAFEVSLAAWAAKAPERASRTRSWPAWVAALERADVSEGDLARAVLAAVARDPDFGRGRAMNLDRWLTEGRFESWLVVEGRAPAVAGQRAVVAPWIGPPDIRAAVAAALGGEAGAVSYLDPAGWDAERRVVLARTGFARDRLVQVAGPVLQRLGVRVEASTSNAGHQRVTP